MDVKLADLTMQERYKIIVGLIVPRPIAWVSTVNAAGVNNCAPYSFFNAFSEEPPLCVLGFGRRPDDLTKHSLDNILATNEFVVNLVDEATANAMHVSSENIPEGESEFTLAGVTPTPASVVRHPRIKEAVAGFECRVWKSIEVSHERVLVIGEMLLAFAREGVIDPANKRISDDAYKPIGRLYANRYCTTRERFTLPGPLPK